MVFDRIKRGLNKLKTTFQSTRSLFKERLKSLLGRSIDEETLQEMEKLFFEADLGVETATLLTQNIRTRHNAKTPPEEMLEKTKEDLLGLFEAKKERTKPTAKPHVILVVGVNGSGKTTSIAKLANNFKQNGASVLVAAGDTFRAAAVEQLAFWCEQAGANLVRGRPNQDPASLVYDAIEKAKKEKVDILLIDTAGRLQNKDHLMQELEKMRRICQKLLPDAPHETLLTLDATTGQNGLDQAQVFHSMTPITGIILTKMDGSAKGGIIVPIQKKLRLPVQFLGLGESLDDLQPFSPESFVEALFEN